MSIPAVVVVGVYIIWVSATVAYQFHSWCPKWLKMLNIFGLIPIWTFFAPNPGMTDFYLLYRDRLADGSLDNWRNLQLKDSANGARLALWNPTKRKHKALSDLVNSLAEFVTLRGGDNIFVSVPYILILGVVTARPHSLGTSATQFLLLEHNGFVTMPQGSRVLVLSQFHRLTSE